MAETRYGCPCGRIFDTAEALKRCAADTHEPTPAADLARLERRLKAAFDMLETCWAQMRGLRKDLAALAKTVDERTGSLRRYGK